MEEIPVIQITFERMKQSIAHAISDQQIEFDSQFNAALDEALEPSRIQQIINEQVRRELDSSIKSSIESYFRYGLGAEYVTKEVQQKLTTLCFEEMAKAGKKHTEG